MLAHIQQGTGKRQDLYEHSRTVAALCQKSAEIFGLGSLAYLCGLLHDMGKATAAFERYLEESCTYPEKMPTVHPHHAATGAFFAYNQWQCSAATAPECAAAQTIALCILGHHTGLIDCLNTDGASPFLNSMTETPEYYNEAKSKYLDQIAREAELNELFKKACDEFDAFYRKFGDRTFLSFGLGMTARLLLSVLVDADRWDAACFEYGEDPLEQRNVIPDWSKLFNTFEDFRLKKLSSEGELNRIRSEISQLCVDCAANDQGIVTLSVPTGGGKTFSTLRYALAHAKEYNLRKIFYIIPYNTILDQNAEDIRNALDEYSGILEHHSGIVFDDDDEWKNYRRLTERWDADIILTSLVQFLNACFKGSNSDARRLHRLANSVLIFDEIQSLPKHCKALFEYAISYLSRCCGATVVLCTATQPSLDLSPQPRELISEPEKLYTLLKRTNYHPQLSPARSYEQASEELCRMLKESSVLMIVNTKSAANKIDELVYEKLKGQGLRPLRAETAWDRDNNLTLAELAMEQAPDNGVLCVHLTTFLCPAHRMALLDWVKLWTKRDKRVFCVSTALIEAGINVSFPVLVRSLAGLPNIIQAAGRCNRNMEAERGEVYIWDLKEENLIKLPDIQNGGNCSRDIFEFSGELPDTPSAIKQYFAHEWQYTKKKSMYPLSKLNTTLLDLLGNNTVSRKAYGILHGTAKARMFLCQSFRTAGQEFEVIPDNTKTVLVPFGKGRELIALLGQQNTMQEEAAYLHQAQRFSVSLYEGIFRRLADEKAIYPVGSSNVMVLKESYYSQSGGVRLMQGEMELLAL